MAGKTNSVPVVTTANWRRNISGFGRHAFAYLPLSRFSRPHCSSVAHRRQHPFDSQLIGLDYLVHRETVFPVWVVLISYEEGIRRKCAKHDLPISAAPCIACCAHLSCQPVRKLFCLKYDPATLSSEYCAGSSCERREGSTQQWIYFELGLKANPSLLRDIASKWSECCTGFRDDWTDGIVYVKRIRQSALCEQNPRLCDGASTTLLNTSCSIAENTRLKRVGASTQSCFTPLLIGKGSNVTIVLDSGEHTIDGVIFFLALALL